MQVASSWLSPQILSRSYNNFRSLLLLLPFINAINTDVIIIGAGPSGLSLACQLRQVWERFCRRGVGNICSEVERDLGDVADCQIIQLDPRVRDIFGMQKEFGVFLRPDNHIAFTSSEISFDAVREYLKKKIF